MMRFFTSTILIVATALSGCATRRAPVDLSAFRAASPHSILVVPVVNKSLDVDAPNYLLSTLSVPLAEKGYYVFPINTSKFVLEQEGFTEGEQVQAQNAADLAKLFDADAVLFVTIDRWDAQYVLLTTVVTVDLRYRMMRRDGAEIWASKEHVQWQPQNSTSGSPIAALVAAAITAAMARAAPNYMPLARLANRQAFVTGPAALPDGPYAK